MCECVCRNYVWVEATLEAAAVIIYGSSRISFQVSLINENLALCEIEYSYGDTLASVCMSVRVCVIFNFQQYVCCLYLYKATLFEKLA